MAPTRRHFLWTAAAATGALAWYRAQGVQWTAADAADAGWAPGVEGRVVSSCLVCPARCGIRARTVDGRLVAIGGNALHPVSRGGLCPRGIAGVQMQHHPDRLASPLVRTGIRGSGEWREVSTEGAVALIAERLRALRAAGRPEGLAVVAGYCEGSMRELWRSFLRAFGSPNYVADDYADGTDAVMALMHGIPRRPAYDLDQSALVLSFGAPLFESWWSPLQAYVAFGMRRAAGAETARSRFVQVDTRFSRTAARAHEWVGIRPGTYGVLALGIAYVLLKEELFDAAFVERQVAGFDDYRELVLGHYRTEEVSAATGVPVERIVALAKSFGERRPAVAVLGPDVLLAPDGLLAGIAVHSLNVLVGSVNRPGGVLFGDDPPLDPLAEPVLDVPARTGLARAPALGTGPAFGAGDEAARFAGAVASGAGPAPDALLLYYANPLASASDPALWRTVLERVPFVVSFSPFLDETARHADLVLPDLMAYERWQDAPAPASYPYPVWGVARPIVEPPAGAMHTGEALLTLARGLGGTVASSLPYADVEALLRARARGLFRARRGMTFGEEFERAHLRQMEERGWWLPAHLEFDAFWDDLVARGGWMDLFYDHTDPARLARTADGRIHLLPVPLERALRAEGRGRAAYRLGTAPDAPPADGFPLRLLPYRISTLASGTLALEPWLAEQPTIFGDRHWVPWVEVHPDTAAGLGLGDGALVRVRSARGDYRARLKTFPGVAPDTVCAPYGLRHPDGELANPLALTDGTGDPLTGLPSWSSTFVRLERA